MIEDLQSEGIDAHGVAADAHDEHVLSAAVTELADRFGRIDVLHHAVPGPLGRGFGPALDIPAGLMRTFLEARVVSALVASQASAPFLRRSKGALLFTSGTAGQVAHPQTGIVGVPQAALRMLVEHLRQEFSSDAVFVGLIPVDGVPAYRDPRADAERTDTGAGVPLGDRFTAADVAEAHFRMARARDREEWVVGEKERGLADTPFGSA
ncbi:hypothetical protein A5742_24355 [Mycolicibacterium fortuitum]|uniref:Uncharacterized protein n=2 Tax=Mycolicibacterium fortuitum TaxID=1766 RepID=A0ABD6QPN7_MYCFO|nr:hypothetical protein A5742_24355 [Mycolicibacterium fortuitum]